jgi:TolA-binding protein
LLLTGAWADGPFNADADKFLKTAQQAHSQKDYPAAVARYREVLTKYSKTSSEPAATFGLAVCLIDGLDRKYDEALKLLGLFKGAEKGIDHQQVRYYRGAALRGLGVGELQQALAKSKDAERHRAKAGECFSDAITALVEARDGFLRRGADPEPGKDLSADAEWAAKATCEAAELLLRQGKYKEAAGETRQFMDSAAWSRSKHRSHGLYVHGFASFHLKDYAAAEKSLSMVAPFKDVRFGTHARYLLARVFHLADERAEAALHYEAVLSDYNREKKEAQVLLAKPAVLAKDPEEKWRVEALVRDGPPDHVVRAVYYSGVLLMEAGRFSEARDRLQNVAKAPAAHPVTTEAQLRLGICLVQLKEGQAALNTLTPLVERDKSLADQALLWMARAAVLLVPDPNQKKVYDKALSRAIGLFEQAAQRTAEQVGADPAAKERHGEVLLETVDVLLQFQRGADAAKICQVLTDKQLLPNRAEDILQRLAIAWHLAGDYDKSDAECKRFLTAHADSPLAGEILFRYAENSYFRTLAAEKNTKDAKALTALREETIKRYQALITAQPESPRASNARFVIGLLAYRQGDLPKAQAALEAIPQHERGGDVAITSYLLADCILRQMPPGLPEDALAAGKMEAQLKQAAELLDAFTTAVPSGPQTAEAIVRLGQCLQRLASMQAQVAERNKLYQEARAAFEKVLQPQFNNQPEQAQALMERARCRVLYGGDLNKSINELMAFTNDPLRMKPCAPLAVIQVGAWLYGQNRGAQALPILAKFAADYNKRPDARADMRGLLAYHHGVLLMHNGKLAEAREQLTDALKLIPYHAEAADAAVRWTQCREEEIDGLREQGKRLLQSSDAAERAKGQKLLDAATAILAESAAMLDTQAEKSKGEGRLRLLYEAAWIYREVAEAEVAAARAAWIDAQHKKLGDKVKKLPPLEVDPKDLPVQPTEKKMRARYLTLIDDFADAPLATSARLELAEHFAQRGENDKAIQQLVEALDREPPPEMAEKVRFLLGACQAAKGNHKAALAQFDIVGKGVKSFLAAQAKYRAGEVLMETKDWAEAAKRFAFFRDTPQFQQLPGLSDRALLRLGHVYAALEQWDEARKAHELLLSRHPGSRWTQAAHYGVAWALEKQKQWEPAAAAYAKAAEGQLSETAAMATLRRGLCQLALNRPKDAVKALLEVPEKFGFDEWNAAALLHAADGYVQMNERDAEVQVLQRLVREYPESPQAQEARKRLKV